MRGRRRQPPGLPRAHSVIERHSGANNVPVPCRDHQRSRNGHSAETPGELAWMGNSRRGRKKESEVALLEVSSAFDNVVGLLYDTAKLNLAIALQ